ncbi:LytR C-terminal domain-containing protein, partial [Solirubrobacter deserti]
IALFAALAVGGAAAYGALRPSGGSGRARATPTPTPTPTPVATVEPADVTVAVLNGTTVPGLAAALSGELAAAGFTEGGIDTFSDQQRTTSVVQYAPGHRAEAEAVGRTLGISRREPVGADGRALAPGAPVIVIAGIDQAP